MIIEDDIKLDYSDVLIRPKRSTLTSRFDVELKKTYTFYHSNKEWTGIPIMASNMDTTGTFEMHEELSLHDMITCIARHYNKNGTLWHQTERRNKLCAMSGISSKEIFELVAISNTYPDISFIGLDVANGYTINFVESIKKLREHLPESTIIAGNVVTADMTAELLLAGADIVKIGVGPGSVCTTRTKTGIGYPQLSAVLECADAAHAIGGHIIADGGCNSSGDIVKAFAAGADFVMIGGLLAGHEECDGKYVFEDDNPEPVGMEFYGMSSKTAMNKHKHPNREYRGEEGKTVMIKYNGPVRDTVIDILSGIRSACTYVGAKRLKDLSKCATFVRVNSTHNRIYEKQ